MIVQPFSYFSQVIQAAGAPAASYVVRTDAYSASLSLAVPFNYFSGSFGMTDYRSDISPSIRGTGTAISFAATGSSPTGTTRANGVTKFSADGYYTSVINSGIAYPFGSSATTRPAAMNMGSSNFVWEGFISFPAAPTGNGISFLGNYGDMNITMNQTPSYIRYLITGDVYADSSTAITKPTNTWVHWAFVRSSNNFYGYWSGSRVISFSSGNTIANTATAAYLGYPAFSLLTASFQDFRVYKGTDKGYTGATITAPQSIVTLA